MLDWQLPPGTDRGVWDYTHNPELARNYDASLAGTSLLELDLAYCEEHFHQPGSLVDLGCGTGRLALRFAAKGFDCTAVDLSPEMLAVLREKAGGTKIETVEANLVELPLGEDSFDYAACLFSTLGMIRGRENRMKFLRHVHRILKLGGRFVVHAHNRGHHRFRLRWSLEDVVKKLKGREAGEYPMPQHSGGAPLTLHHFSAGELRRDLREAGFDILDFRPVSANADGKPPRFFPEARAYGFLLLAGKS